MAPRRFVRLAIQLGLMGNTLSRWPFNVVEFVAAEVHPDDPKKPPFLRR